MAIVTDAPQKTFRVSIKGKGVNESFYVSGDFDMEAVKSAFAQDARPIQSAVRRTRRTAKAGDAGWPTGNDTPAGSPE